MSNKKYDMGGVFKYSTIKKNKGFTLTELLAVIVVLAIIALIAVPIVLNIIEKARKGAAVASARSYIKATETYIVSSELDKEKITLICNNKYNVTTTTIIDSKMYQSINDLVEVKGSLPIGSEDYIKIDENNQVKEALLTINGYVILIIDDEVVSITKGSIISVKSITLDKTNEKIKLGKTLKLNATITPDKATNKTVTWTSSDESIATVDSNGLVTALKEGTITIKASTINNKEATCEIKVYDALIVTRSILDKGTFKNVTPTYLTNQVDGSDGFTITGNVPSNPYNSKDHNISLWRRWDYEIDLTNYDKITFYARQNAAFGVVKVYVSDGLKTDSSTKAYAKKEVYYGQLPATWTKYDLDISEISGKHIVSFVGGYVDDTANQYASTSFCNIKFE